MGMAAAFSTQPRRAALAPSRKELEKSARDNARAGDSCSCLLLQGVLLQGARLQPGACRSLPALLGACSWGSLEAGGRVPPPARSCSLVVGWDPAAGAARRFPGQGRQGSEGLEGNQGSEEQPSQAEVRLAMALGAFLGAQGEPQRVSRPEIILLLHCAFKT